MNTKVSQLKMFYYRRAMLKDLLLPIILLFFVFNLNAQEKNNVKLGIETGVLLLSDAENLGLFINVEPKIKFSENSYIGMKIGVTFNSHVFDNNDSFQFGIDDVQNNALLSFVPTFDYYLNEYNFGPYLGLGVGYHIVANYIDVFRIPNSSEGVMEGSVNKRVGFLLRGGFESARLRFGLEYNLIPKADIEIPNGRIIGTIENSYFGLSIGFTIIGGKSSM